MSENVNGSLPQTDEAVQTNNTGLSLTASLESLLFVAEAPVDAAQLASALQLSEAEAIDGLQALDEYYRTNQRGLRVQKNGGKYVLITAPAAAPILEAFLNLEISTRLSSAALEALAIVAYRQPVTRAQVEAVRGVDCGGVLRTLQQYELIEEVDRLDSVGRPILYGATENFMRHFGITNMNELPPLESEDADALWSATELAEEDASSLLEEAD